MNKVIVNGIDCSPDVLARERRVYEDSAKGYLEAKAEADSLRAALETAIRERDEATAEWQLRTGKAERERDAWVETARAHAGNEDYYRGLIDAAIKDEPSAYVTDDGSISEDVLRAKLPEIVATLRAERDEVRERFAALTPGGHSLDYDVWTSAMDQIGTLRAERDAAVALIREVADSGIEFDDERISYVVVQIDRETWVAVRARAQKGAPE